jgi:hypothetical protein
MPSGFRLFGAGAFAYKYFLFADKITAQIRQILLITKSGKILTFIQRY